MAGSVPIAHPAAVADHLVLIMEGVYGPAQALGAEGPARRARALAEMLLPETYPGTHACLATLDPAGPARPAPQAGSPGCRTSR